MPVRLVCPSCSAALSVKDEYAGRAVKCPKCGGVIPAAPPPSKPAAALPPPPAPEPEKPPFEELDAPPKPKIKGRPTGKPAAKADAEDDAKPATRRSTDADRDDTDDRPTRTKRKRDADDEEDDRPAKKKGGSNIAIILGVVGFLLLTCCGAGGWGGWWMYNRSREQVKALENETAQKSNPVVKPGTVVRAEDLVNEFKADPTAAGGKYVNQNFIVNGRLHDIDVATGEVTAILEGTPGDGGMRVSCAMAKSHNTTPFIFARGQRVLFSGRCVGWAAGSVSFNNCTVPNWEADPAERADATALIAAYSTDTSGDARFKDKPVRVAGAVVELFLPDGDVVVVPVGKKGGGKKIRVAWDPSYKAVLPNVRVGATVTIQGKCEGVVGGEIVIADGWFTP